MGSFLKSVWEQLLGKPVYLAIFGFKTKHCKSRESLQHFLKICKVFSDSLVSLVWHQSIFVFLLLRYMLQKVGLSIVQLI